MRAKPLDHAARGRMGAKAFLVKVPPHKRQEIARNAATARWKGTTKAERSKAGRRAVLARWASVKPKTSTR